MEEIDFYLRKEGEAPCDVCEANSVTTPPFIGDTFMKKTLLVLSALAVLACCFTGCASTKSHAKSCCCEEKAEKKDCCEEKKSCCDNKDDCCDDDQKKADHAADCCN